ncbi:MAG: glutathione binding-like protein [Rhodobacteraceae bacterium]|nr:glutathione binding-like protein [Paracoccaceae bacterium]
MIQNKSSPALLYCFGESGNSYKAALTLELAGIPWKPVFVDFFKGETRTPEFLKLNPMGEAPVLVKDTAVLSQSGVIQQFVVQHSGQFGGTNQKEKQEVLRWVLWDNHKMSSLCGTTRFLNNFIPEDKRPLEVIQWHQGRLKTSFKILNNFLENREWLVGKSITVADLSCCGYLYYPEPFGFNRSDWPNISRWLENISSLKGWQHPYDLMPKKNQ